MRSVTRRRRGPAFTPWEHEQVERLVLKGWSNEQIGAELGRPAGSIKHKRSKLGLPTKSAVDAQENAPRLNRQPQDCRRRQCLKHASGRQCRRESEPGRPYCADHLAAAYRLVGLVPSAASGNLAVPAVESPAADALTAGGGNVGVSSQLPPPASPAAALL